MAQELIDIGLNLRKVYMNTRNDEANEDDRWLWMGDVALRRARNSSRHFSEDEKLKLKVAVTLIKNVMNLIKEHRLSANVNNPAVAGPSSLEHVNNPAVVGSPNQSNIAQDCKDIALTLWRAYQAILSGRAVDEDDINRYLEMGRAALLKVQNSSQNLCVPDKQKLQAGIALIKCSASVK